MSALLTHGLAALGLLVAVESSAVLTPAECVVGPRTTRTIMRQCTASFDADAQPELECVTRRVAIVCDVRLDAPAR